MHFVKQIRGYLTKKNVFIRNSSEISWTLQNVNLLLLPVSKNKNQMLELQLMLLETVLTMLMCLQALDVKQIVPQLLICWVQVKLQAQLCFWILELAKKLLMPDQKVASVLQIDILQ